MITFKWKFPCFNEPRDAKKCPEATSADRPEHDHRHPHLFYGIDQEAHDPIHYDAGCRRSAVRRHCNVCEHVPGRQFQVVEHLADPVLRPLHVKRDSVRDRLEAEGGVSGETGGNVGAAEEAAIVLLGVDEGDTEAALAAAEEEQLC